jgi:hypothetical protein
LQTLDRIDECFAELDRLLQLDPFSMMARAALENALYLERNFERVVVESKRTLELDPSFVISAVPIPSWECIARPLTSCGVRISCQVRTPR